LFQPFSNDARYSKFTEFPKFHVLAVAPSFTPSALNPAIDPLAHVSGSLVKPRVRRCAFDTLATNASIITTNENRFIISVPVVLPRAQCALYLSSCPT
jgi:hypothetical protein